MSRGDDLYAFVFKGAVAQDAVARELNRNAEEEESVAEKIEAKLPLDLLDKDYIASAQKMASVYTAIAAFENSARKFIQDRLLEEIGADWWTSSVPQGIRDQAEKRKRDEEQIRWHGTRGASMIFYTQMPDLVSIMQNNHTRFQDHIESIEWARQIFSSLERSRNVIMHSGELSMNDIERVAMNIRDWLRQVGG
jgi:hypothetical protein